MKMRFYKPALYKMFLPVAAEDTFQAVDLGMGHQGELLGQGTDLSMSHACKKITQVYTITCQISPLHHRQL